MDAANLLLPLAFSTMLLQNRHAVLVSEQFNHYRLELGSLKVLTDEAGSCAVNRTSQDIGRMV